jgi:transposase
MEAKFTDVPDALWERIAPLLPKEKAKPEGGRPRVADRVVLAGIVYRLRTGCQWKALPSEFGSGSTCHLRFQQWTRAGVFDDIFAVMVKYYDKRRGIQWQWTSMDSATVKAPKGGTTPVRTRRTARNSA